MRMLSIGQWHHVVYMVISMALLGYGAAGSLLFLFMGPIKKRVDFCLITLAGATAVSFPLAFGLSQKVGLDPLQLVWQVSQWWNMLLSYVLMALPFLFAGGIVGIILTAAGEQAHRMYAVDLFGAGTGAIAIVPALYLGPPWMLIPLLEGLVLIGALFCSFPGQNRRVGLFTLPIALIILGLVHGRLPPRPQIHHTKGLPMTLALPDARLEAETAGPMGLIQVVGSRHIRDVPGLSLKYGLEGRDQEKDLPEQKSIFLDGGRLGPITRFAGDPRSPEHLDYTSMALPYHIRKPGKALVIGGGGGGDVLLSLLHGTSDITVLESNQQVLDLMKGRYAEFSGHLYLRPEVGLVAREARQFLHATDNRYDLIILSLLDSQAASMGGLLSGAEDYLFTVEAFKAYLNHLTGRGMVSITRWLKLPPRDSLKVMATALEALSSIGLSHDPGKHLLFIRSWKTSTILLSRLPFRSEEITRAIAFCKERNFDLVFYEGMTSTEANQYDMQDFPYYHEGARSLRGPNAKAFLSNYAFDVSPATDDRPYFSHFIRWDKVPDLYTYLQREWLPMVELGSVFIIATLVQAVLASGLLILVPLFFLGRLRGLDGNSGAKPGDILCTLVYFGCIGLAFMLLEMALLPQFTLLLSHPVYSAAVVLGTLLVVAGAGSMCVRFFQSRGSWFLCIPVLFIVLWVGFHGIAGNSLFGWALAKPVWVRLVVSIGVLAALSFFLGWPFPWGLRRVAGSFPGLVPWAWGINACASVVGAVLGKFLAVSLGFSNVMFVACILYVLALVVFQKWFRSKRV
jgi:hypothetical protein